MAKSTLISHGRVAENRKARYNYSIEDTVEAGIVLVGSEVKSLRMGRATISEAFAQPEGREIFLINAHIPMYQGGGKFQHEETRKRRLLLHKKQIDRLSASVQREGMTLVPLSLFFNDKGIAKLSLGLGKGKKFQDKREDIKKRNWNRQKSRLMRDKG
ncbi:MAG: SsrA-binding protein SmpB [Rhodospirillaceae bacterium]|nr:SsrA-binding protein SmpB [Rhodospirillaceae bacterium]